MSFSRTCLRLSRNSSFIYSANTSTATSVTLCLYRQSRYQHDVSAQPESVPLRKQLKDEVKARKKAAKTAKSSNDQRASTNPKLDAWELTVGIEVHAHLNTVRKLFSEASTSITAEPNQHVALFDAALPGAQPQFQKATLIPAIRAALALNCDVQSRSSWDRKHYFYQDQPNGYQITQYYEPFARNGWLRLSLDDGIDPADADSAGRDGGVTVGIKQVQMEQDTAKTTHQVPSTYLLDFNRVSHPLIEIITLPHIHSPATAAATVRKIQSLLKSVDACTAGMELGGLRADVNVSVRPRGDSNIGTQEYAGVTGLGTRTEIKNLSSFKAVEDAVTAERDRQIAVLEAGSVIEGETRGWTIGSTETTRLRSKEGEVDYRYMPDPDLGLVYIDDRLVEHLRDTLPELPEDTISRTVRDFGLSRKDANTLLAQDDGERLEYCARIVDAICSALSSHDRMKVGKLVGNWILHELGGFMAADNQPWSELSVTYAHLAAILENLLQKQITARSAKQLLQQIYSDSDPAVSVEDLIDEGNLRLRPISEEEYRQLAQDIFDQNPDMVQAIKDRGQKGKAMFFVGQMIRNAEEGTIEAEKARQVVEEMLGI